MFSAIDGSLTDTKYLGQRGTGSTDNEGVLHILQISRIGAIPSDRLVSYFGRSIGEVSYSFIYMQPMYSTFSADWADIDRYVQT